MTEVHPSTDDLQVAERVITSADQLDLNAARFEVLSFGPEQENNSTTAVDLTRTSPMDAAAEMIREQIVCQAQTVLADPLYRSRLVNKRVANRIVAQAAAKQRKHQQRLAAHKRAVKSKDPIVAQAAMGQTTPQWGTADPADETIIGTRQINVEDFFTTLDFVPLPRNIRFELYESQMFEENHITGACLTRLAGMVTKRGWEMAPYQDQLQDLSQDDEEVDPEKEALETWFDNLNSVSDFREIIEQTAAYFAATSNAYLEIIREEFGDPEALPAGVETAIPSTMRVLRGHRGYVQWIMGQFRWFNVYMPNVEDRIAGMALWTEYWEERGVDVESDEFMASPWARTLNSQMPQNVWNPHLTDIKHFKDLSLSSKYYGFPKDYRLGKLDALLQWSIDYNISLQKNNRIPPFCILFHGRLTDESREEVKRYFASLKGPENWGKVPIFEAPGGGGGAGGATGGGSKSGLEIVRIAGDDKDGMFLELWARVIKDIAMHYSFPLDLLTTENSNRATIEIAEQMFNENVVNRYHAIFEDFFKKLTKYDLGCEAFYLHFIDLDTDDYAAKAQEAKIWHDTGVLNPNEIRKKYLNLGPREGGDQYFGVMANPEDEAAEMLNVAKARDIFRDPLKLKAALDAANSTQGQAAASGGDQNTPATSAAAPSTVAQADMMTYLLEKYGA